MLLDFARAVAAAKDRAEMIDVLASVDEYVEQVLAEAGGRRRPQVFGFCVGWVLQAAV